MASSSSASLSVLQELADVLDTGLDRQSLACLVGLCEHNVNPEALAAVVKELRREGAALAQTHSVEGQ